MSRLLKSAGRALFAIALILMVIVVTTGIVYAVVLATSSLAVATFVGFITTLFCSLTVQNYFSNY